MSGIICKSVMDNCKNPYDSYGEICVGCNCCGRFRENNMWEARYELATRRLSELIEHLTSEHFQTNLQQTNICTSIAYWGETLKEIIEHIDFDKQNGENDEQKSTGTIR